MSTSNAPDAKRNDALQALENAISAGDDSALNLDEFADEDLEVPVRLDPAITLSNLRAVLDRPILLPLGTEAVHLDEKDYRLVDGFLPHAVRITVDREFYEMHADSVEFWTPGSPTFPDLDIYRR
ncbi:hypothetical protein [Brucella oryzae]|uniref:hypothetical protein n=1 Tax=Brucella oryzae TaxID=335286 RepID=UPI0035BC85CC